jgi:hypothetical protein
MGIVSRGTRERSGDLVGQNLAQGHAGCVARGGWFAPVRHIVADLGERCHRSALIGVECGAVPVRSRR